MVHVVVEGGGAGRRQGHGPDVGTLVATATGDAVEEIHRPLVGVLLGVLDEVPHQRITDPREHLMRNEFRGQERGIDRKAVEQRCVRRVVLTGDREQPGVGLARRHQQRQVRDVVVGRCRERDRRGQIGTGKHFRIGGVARDEFDAVDGRRTLVDHSHGDPRTHEVRGQVRAEAPVATDHPAAVLGDGQRRGHRIPGVRCEPGRELVGPRRAQGHEQLVTEQIEGIDDDRAAESADPFDQHVLHRPADHRHVRAHECRRHGDGEVRLVVVGERDDAGAVLAHQARTAQFVWVTGVGGQTRDIGVEGSQIKRLDAAGYHVEDHDAMIAAVQGPGHDLARLAEPGKDHERFAQPAHLTLETLQPQRLLEPAVLQQRQH